MESANCFETFPARYAALRVSRVEYRKQPNSPAVPTLRLNDIPLLYSLVHPSILLALESGPPIAQNSAVAVAVAMAAWSQLGLHVIVPALV